MSNNQQRQQRKQQRNKQQREQTATTRQQAQQSGPQNGTKPGNAQQGTLSTAQERLCSEFFQHVSAELNGAELFFKSLVEQARKSEKTVTVDDIRAAVFAAYTRAGSSEKTAKVRSSEAVKVTRAIRQPRNGFKPSAYKRLQEAARCAPATTKAGNPGGGNQSGNGQSSGDETASTDSGQDAGSQDGETRGSVGRSAAEYCQQLEDAINGLKAQTWNPQALELLSSLADLAQDAAIAVLNDVDQGEQKAADAIMAAATSDAS